MIRRNAIAFLVNRGHDATELAGLSTVHLLRLVAIAQELPPHAPAR